MLNFLPGCFPYSLDTMVTLVVQMLDLNKRLQAAKAPHEQEVLAGMIDVTDRQIDRLVYELYGMTEDEVAIVEEKLGSINMGCPHRSAIHRYTHLRV